MTIRFSAKDARVPDEQRDIMEKKLNHRLGKFLPGDDEELFVKVSEKNKVYKVELNMPYFGYQLRTETTERDNPLTALDRGIDAMEGQVRKCKTKFARRLRPNVQQAEPESSEPVLAGESPENEYHIVKIKQYEMKPMSAMEAVVLMDLLGHNFYMFHNSELNKLCTVYRRNDGDYGMITSE